MRRSFVPLIILVTLLTWPFAALAQPRPDQTPPPGAPKPATVPRPDQPPPPGQIARPEPPKLAGQPVNVKVECTVTDHFGGAAPVAKTVTLMLADRRSGMIRSEGMLPGYGKVQLHVDAEVMIIAEAKVLTQIALQYDLVDPKAAPAERQSQTTQIRESLNTILENGKLLVVSQSADPVTDRKVTVEVKATIVR